MIGYYSTRDKNQQRVSFKEALLKGLAPDGGLFIPDRIPKIEPEAWQNAKSLPELGFNILSNWLGNEVPSEILKLLLEDALSFVIPLHQLEKNLYILELFHGPTLSFKDIGARTMARLMSHFLSELGQNVTILVATSGDTGSAVADGFAGLENIEVILLYPKGKVSKVQERQLIVKRQGVKTLAVEGSFDDCQRLVKEAFVAQKLAHLPLSSANSINIGRLLPQTLYYIWAVKNWLDTSPLLKAPNICVPSGNLGNLTGGILAAQTGLSVNRFIAAHNANSFFPNYLKELAKPYEFKTTIATLSNAMDVGAPSNFERLHHLLGNDALRQSIWGISVTDDITKQRMKQTYKTNNYLVCPHTAVGIEAVQRYQQQTGDTTPVISLATAHPAKFSDAWQQLELQQPKHETLDKLWELETNMTVIAPKLEALCEVLL